MFRFRFPRTASLTVCVCFTLQAQAFHVIVDPGHGGYDHGAVSKDLRGVTESMIALHVAQLLKQELKNTDGYKVTLTRDSDRYISLEDRSDLATQLKGDLFISIHVNASRDHRVHGKEIYFQNQLPPDEESLFLANQENQGKTSARSQQKRFSDVDSIVDDLERNHRIFLSAKLSEFLHMNWSGQNARHSRPIRQAPFHVISNVPMPSALVEIGYISNTNEAKRLIQPDYQKNIATRIFAGIKQFKEFMDKTARTKLD